jgi:hypothetical protein
MMQMAVFFSKRILKSCRTERTQSLTKSIIRFERWKESILLLNHQEHFTEQGIRRLLDLTYGLAEKGSRQYTKEQYLEWGLEWLNNPNRQKRRPRG